MSDYKQRLIENLKFMYDGEKCFFPDVTLRCVQDGSEYKCHRIVLGAASEYFWNLFNWSSSNIVEVHNNLSGTILNLVLSYIYSGEVELTLVQCFDILRAANYFILDELIDDCINFLIENLDQDNCVDILCLAYELDLCYLIEQSICCIGLNFPYITNDMKKSSKLFSLPSTIIKDIFKCDDLVTRDDETDLPTTPVQREKDILEFIICYCESTLDTSISISSFLPCLKWPILNIYRAKDYVFNKLEPYMNNVNGLQLELDELLKIDHSKWFLSPDENEPTDDDKLMYGTRSFTCSEILFSKDIGVNNSNSEHIMTITNLEAFSICPRLDEYIQSIDIVLRQWNDRTIIGGIGILFKCKNKKRYDRTGITKDEGSCVKTIHLEPDEHVIGVSGNSDFLIHNLLFKTSKGRTYGPYGSNEEIIERRSEGNLMHRIADYRDKGYFHHKEDEKYYYSIARGPHDRIPLDSFLIGVGGIEVMVGGELAIRNVRFIFLESLPGSSFLISKTIRYLSYILHAKKVRDRYEMDFENPYSDVESDEDRYITL